MRPSPTVTASWLRAIVRGLSACGLDTQHLLPRCGLDPARLEEPHTRIPIRVVTRLWEHAIAQYGHTDLGLRVARHIPIGALHALGNALLSSTSCAEACRRIERYSPLISNAGGWVITEAEAWTDIYIYSPWQGKQVHHADIDLAMASAVLFLRRLTQDRFDVLQVDLMRPPPGVAESYTSLFSCPVNFDQEDNRIRCSRASWIQHLPGGNLEISALSDQLIEQYLQHMETDPLITQVRGEVVERLPGGEPALSEVAARLNISRRTLQRKLAEAGTTFAGIIRSTREELANTYLGDPRYSLKEIALMLGFSDQANFNRAFRQWYGVAPGLYRRQLLAKTMGDQH